MLPTLIDDLGRAVTSELLDRLRGGEVMSCALVPLSFRIEDEYELQGTVIHLSLLFLRFCLVEGLWAALLCPSSLEKDCGWSCEMR